MKGGTDPISSASSVPDPMFQEVAIDRGIFILPRSPLYDKIKSDWDKHQELHSVTIEGADLPVELRCEDGELISKFISIQTIPQRRDKQVFQIFLGRIKEAFS